jgi:hypothetical protein
MKFGERAIFGIKASKDRWDRYQAQAAARRKDRDMKKMSKHFKKDILRGSIQQQQTHVISEQLAPHKSAKRRFQKLHLMDALYSETELWYRVVTEQGKLPYGVSVDDLLKPEFANGLTVSCLRPVRVEYNSKDPSKGLWIVVEYEESNRGVPLQLAFNKAFEMIPVSRPPLTFALGAVQGGAIRLLDLGTFPHLIIGGSTGYGKSNMLNQIIVTIVRRNRPSEVQLYLFDMKNGNELKPYRNLPHVAKFVKKKEDVIPALDELRKLVDERWVLFDSKNKKDIRGWNATQPEKLPIIAVIFDELATIMLDKDYRSEVETKLSDLAAVCRSTGVHIVFATQRPSTDVVTGLLKVNFDGRIGFAVPTIYDSRTILDEGGAENLRGYLGRALYIERGGSIEAQTPLLTEEVRDDHLRIVQKEHHITEDGQPEVDIIDVLSYALENLDGKLPYRVLLDEFRPMGMTEPKLFAMLNEASQRGIMLDGKPYKVVKGKGRNATRLVPVRQSALTTLIKGRRNADELDTEKMTA